MQPPAIFVHCVAGVNRSPMVVVWWLCRYHGLHLRDAWDLVRMRRDSGAHWKDVTLGGTCPPEDYSPDPSLYEKNAIREFQHPISDPTQESLNPGNTHVKKDKMLKLPYPKYLWFKSTANLLKQYFKHHWTEKPALGKACPSTSQEEVSTVQSDVVKWETDIRINKASVVKSIDI